MFTNNIYFHSRLIFAGKAGSLPLEWIPVGGSNLVGSGLACKYYTRMEVNGSSKHPSLLQYGYCYNLHP
jgi:hypothetical protein